MSSKRLRRLLREFRRLGREYLALAAVVGAAHYLVYALDDEGVVLGGEAGRQLDLLRKELTLSRTKMMRERNEGN